MCSGRRRNFQIIPFTLTFLVRKCVLLNKVVKLVVPATTGASMFVRLRFLLIIRIEDGINTLGWLVTIAVFSAFETFEFILLIGRQ
jgi:hypothetical protein